jgi:hypothetical protein
MDDKKWRKHVPLTLGLEYVALPIQLLAFKPGKPKVQGNR